MRAKTAWSLAVLTSLSVFAPGRAHAAGKFTTQVDALDGKKCKAYLHVDDHAVLPPLVLSQQGTGIYTTGRAVEPALRKLAREKRIAVLTLDKPGIALTDAGRESVDDAVYDRYTQADLVQCAFNALAWARETSPVKLSESVYLSGHSEGAQVLTNLYREMLLSKPAEAARVRLLLLSGMPMDDWREMIDSQLSARNKARFWSGFMSRSDEILRAFGGLTFRYLSHVFHQESLRKTLESLWALKTLAPMHIFHGLHDKNTRAASVMAFEKSNEARKERGESALEMRVRYYDAGHALNGEALRDIADDLEARLRAETGA